MVSWARGRGKWHMVEFLRMSFGEFAFVAYLLGFIICHPKSFHRVAYISTIYEIHSYYDLYFVKAAQYENKGCDTMNQSQYC